VTDERYTPEQWHKQANLSHDWDQAFKSGQWDYLEGLSETPRFGVIAGYLHKLVGRGTVLDAGCGQGVLLDHLDLSRLNYVGFDISATAVSRIRPRPEVTLHVSSVDAFEGSPDERYEAVVFNEVLSQIARPLEVLDRYMTMLKPDGFAIVSLFQSRDPAANARVLTRMLIQEIDAGRYSVLTKAQVTDAGSQCTWVIWCLKPPL
jgi:2-polyprenyl-3-methyl-5-hydroxy-6-metoxy-1,4-benzoquinol methylase